MSMSFVGSVNWKETNFWAVQLGKEVSKSLRKSSLVSALKKGKENYDRL